MNKLFTILFSVFVFVLLCEAKHEFHRHPKEMLNPIHRPLPINRSPYGLRPTYQPKPYPKPTKPFVDPSAPTPFPGQKRKPMENPRQFVDETQ